MSKHNGSLDLQQPIGNCISQNYMLHCDYTGEIYAAKAVPELLNQTLPDKDGAYCRKLSGDPRFEKLIERIKNELN